MVSENPVDLIYLLHTDATNTMTVNSLSIYCATLACLSLHDQLLCIQPLRHSTTCCPLSDSLIKLAGLTSQALQHFNFCLLAAGEMVTVVVSQKKRIQIDVAGFDLKTANDLSVILTDSGGSTSLEATVISTETTKIIYFTPDASNSGGSKVVMLSSKSCPSSYTEVSMIFETSIARANPSIVAQVAALAECVRLCRVPALCSYALVHSWIAQCLIYASYCAVMTG